MSPKTKAAVITAAAVAGVAIVVVVVLNSYGGTPIIIKGYSPEGSYLVLEQGFPPPEEKPDHSVSGEPTSIKLTSAPSKCLVYNFGIFDDFKIDLKTQPAYDELLIDDTDWWPSVGLKFIEGRFNYADPKYTSKEERVIQSLAIEASGAKCKTSGGAEVDPCPTSFPNTWVSYVELTIEVGDDASCP